MNTDNYYTIIPQEVVKDPTLHLMAFKLYALISLYSSKKGYCWASNDYFADYLDKSAGFVSKMINILIERRYLFVYIDKKDNNKRYLIVAGTALKVVDAIRNNCAEKFDSSLVALIKQAPTKPAECNTYSPHGPRSIIINNNINKEQEVSARNKRSTNEFAADSIEVLLSQLLLKCIRDRKSDFKLNFSKAHLQKWALDISRMISRDKRLPEHIENIIIECQKDMFWQNNILSTSKLRKQFDQLELKLCSSMFENEIILDDEKNKRVSNDIASWFCKKILMNRKKIARNTIEFNKIICVSNSLIDISAKTDIKIENIIKYYKRCIISEYIEDNKTVFVGTLCSDTLLNVVFPQYLKKVMPGTRFRKEGTKNV